MTNVTTTKSNIISKFISESKTKRGTEFSEAAKRGLEIDLGLFDKWLVENNKGDIENFSVEEANEYLSFLKTDLKGATYQKKCSTMRTFLAYLDRDKDLKELRTEYVEKEQPEFSVLTKKEVNKILKRMEIRGKKNNWEWKLEGICYKAIIHTMLYTGIRGSEISILKKDHLKAEGGQFWFGFSDTKGNTRNVPIPKQVFDVIEEYLEFRKDKVEHDEQYDWLFLSRQKGNIQRRALLDVLSNIGNETNIETLNAKKFKNTYIYMVSGEKPLNKSSKSLDPSLFKNDDFEIL